MTRDEAIATLRAGLSALSHGEVRTVAFAGFDVILLEPEAAEDLVKQAHDDLVAAMPEMEPAIEALVSSRRSARRA